MYVYYSWLIKIKFNLHFVPLLLSLEWICYKVKSNANLMFYIMKAEQ